MIRFSVSKDEINHVYECDPKETILQLKDKIKKDYDLEGNDYVDIEFLLEKPIRSLGKFNVEPGILPRTMDRYAFNRYELEGKHIQTTFHVVKNFKQPIRKSFFSCIFPKKICSKY